MALIGLCGGSGSGKGAVSRLLLSRGIPVVDADAVYHGLTSHMSECLVELVEAFGSDIVRDGALDRAVLRGIVFSDSTKRTLLNKISHKHVLSEIRREVQRYFADGAAHVVIDAPLLIESGLDKDCDVVVAVIADRNTRVERIVQRDGISRADAERRINSQIPDDHLRERADYIVFNDGSLAELDEAVEGLLTYLKKTEVGQNV